MTLIAEDLLLLLLDDDKGTANVSVDLNPVLGGAVLIQLALAGAVDIGEKQSIWASARVHPVPGVALDDQVLVDAAAVVAEKERSAQDLVGRLGKGLRDRLADRLTAVGMLERREAKILGVFPSTRWPAADRTHQEAVRRDLVSVLVSGNEPDPRTGAIVALLHAIGRAHKSVPHEGLSSREVRARAKEIADGQWAAQAVKRAIDATTAATIAVVTAAAAASS